MELWIRSQDKRILQQVNNLYLNANYDNKRISAYVDDFATNLGEYKTKERALEVLDEIQKKINLINLGHDFGSPMIDLKNPTYIYEMPEE